MKTQENVRIINKEEYYKKDCIQNRVSVKLAQLVREKGIFLTPDIVLHLLQKYDYYINQIKNTDKSDPRYKIICKEKQIFSKILREDFVTNYVTNLVSDREKSEFLSEYTNAMITYFNNTKSQSEKDAAIQNILDICKSPYTLSNIIIYRTEDNICSDIISSNNSKVIITPSMKIDYIKNLCSIYKIDYSIALGNDSYEFIFINNKYIINYKIYNDKIKGEDIVLSINNGEITKKSPINTINNFIKSNNYFKLLSYKRLNKDTITIEKLKNNTLNTNNYDNSDYTIIIAAIVIAIIKYIDDTNNRIFDQYQTIANEYEAYYNTHSNSGIDNTTKNYLLHVIDHELYMYLQNEEII